MSTVVLPRTRGGDTIIIPNLQMRTLSLRGQEGHRWQSKIHAGPPAPSPCREPRFLAPLSRFPFVDDLADEGRLQAGDGPEAALSGQMEVPGRVRGGPGTNKAPEDWARWAALQRRGTLAAEADRC